ncbi:MAG: hypothetical protein Q4C50_10865 [Eubacteriales bacterium]|nr:hypothetical protein [Eubacteriales bacterium]
MKRGRFTVALIGVAFILTGCGGFSSEISGISISKKGVISESVVENFDKDYYDKKELEQEIAAQVESYNAENGKNAVKKKSLRVKDSVAYLGMSYATAKDYAEFNQVDLYVGDIQGAVQAGYAFEGSFFEVSKGTVKEDAPVWGSQIMSGKNYSTVVLREELLVEVPGTIKYVSDNVRVKDKSTAVVEERQTAYILYE